MTRVPAYCFECKKETPKNRGRFCSDNCARINKNRKDRKRYATDEKFRKRKIKKVSNRRKKLHPVTELGFGFKKRNPFDIGRKHSKSSIYERREFIKQKYGATQIAQKEEILRKTEQSIEL